MGAMANTLENLVLDATLRGIALGVTYTTGVSVALHTADPTETGTVGEVTGGTYARKTATFAAASGGSCALAADVTWPADEIPAGTVVTHISIWDQTGTPKCLYYGALASSQTVNAGAPFVLTASGTSVSLD